MNAHLGSRARTLLAKSSFIWIVIAGTFLAGDAQTASPTPTPSPMPLSSRGHGEPTRFDILRGAYGPYRANYDLLFYHLDIRIDPEKKFVSGKNTIRFKMLKDDMRIQLDLADALKIDKILLGTTPLKYERDTGAVFVDFPEMLHAGRVYSIDFYYSGTPVHQGRFGGFTFGTDQSGHPWIYTACEGIGASIWWPNKDQWRDEVESIRSAWPSRITLSMAPTESSWARPTWAMATRAGTGCCITPSITMTCL